MIHQKIMRDGEDGKKNNIRLRLVVIFGVGGSGKMTALRALEDMEYFCLSNLPLSMLSELISLRVLSQKRAPIGLVAHTHDPQDLSNMFEIFRALEEEGHSIELLHLDAPDDVIVRRYTETRRRHPLAQNGSVRDGIQRERALLEKLRERLSPELLNTGAMTVHDLKRLVQSRYDPTRNLQQLAINIMSFGFKHGVPAEANLMFDVRFLPNPYFDPTLRQRRGTDAEVADFVMRQSAAKLFMERLLHLLKFLLPSYEAEGKHHLTISIGCTGGHHRSVAIAEVLAGILGAEYAIAGVNHRDIDR